MSFRITDTSTSRTLASRIAEGRQRSQIAQERITTGKRINRPSDDPAGAETALRLRSSQAAVERFQRSADASETRLLAADGALNSYGLALDRIRTLVLQGASDTSPSAARSSLATEIDSLREQITNIANGRTADGFTFGGSEQSTAPFDSTLDAFTVAAANASVPLVQIEPETPPIRVGVTATAVFSDTNGTIFDTLTSIAAALRGTGDDAADKAALRSALVRIDVHDERASVARTSIGTNLNRVEIARERLTNDTLLLANALERVEGADLAESAIAFREAENSLEAILQTSAQSNRRSLLDFLG